jgi:1,4-alpha-glucan branching enzyme
MAEDPINRRWHHDKMTFGLIYAFSENFMLPISHDEVVHGKGSMLAKMPGDDWQKFANLRSLLGWMWTHPGKKLLFMGGEFAQWREWNHDTELDWHLLEQPRHRGVERWVADLNRLLREEPSLHERDVFPDGFQWLLADDTEHSVFAFLRRPSQGEGPPVVVAVNLTPVPRERVLLGVPARGRWTEALNSDAEVYGGSGVGNPGGVDSRPLPAQGQLHSVRVTLPPLGLIVLRHQPNF